MQMGELAVRVAETEKLRVALERERGEVERARADSEARAAAAERAAADAMRRAVAAEQALELERASVRTQDTLAGLFELPLELALTPGCARCTTPLRAVFLLATPSLDADRLEGRAGAPGGLQQG